MSASAALRNPDTVAALDDAVALLHTMVQRRRERQAAELANGHPPDPRNDDAPTGEVRAGSGA
jgi:hypothetical protein